MMMKQLVKVMAAVLLTLLAVNSFAADKAATEKSIRELMILTGAGDLGIQIMNTQLQELKKLVPEAPESFWDEFMNEVSADDLVTLVIPIYQKHFTEKEIRATIKFYKSPTGQKVIQTLPQVMQESMAVGRAWGRMLAKKIIDKANANKIKIVEPPI